jgi:hypothetical protein
MRHYLARFVRSTKCYAGPEECVIISLYFLDVRETCTKDLLIRKSNHMNRIPMENIGSWEEKFAVCY